MKEKFIELLISNGINAEMGVTPVKYAYIMQMEDTEKSRAFWFVETEGAIDAQITNFVKWNISEYIFACVKNDDYENGKYMVGNIKELSGYGSPEGIHEDEAFMTMSFRELIDALRA